MGKNEYIYFTYNIFKTDQSYIKPNIVFRMFGESAQFTCSRLYFLKWIVPYFLDKTKYSILNGTITFFNITNDFIRQYSCEGYINEEDKPNVYLKIQAFALVRIKGTNTQILLFSNIFVVLSQFIVK